MESKEERDIVLEHMIERIVIIILLLMLVWSKCDGPPPEPNGNIINIETYTDTTYVKHIDTVFFYKDTTITKTVLTYTNVENVKKDTSKLYTFQTHVSDSLISGDIKTKVKVKDSNAVLINQLIAYQPKFPKYIYETDSIFIHDSTIVTKYDTKPKLFFGADISIGSEKNPGGIVPKLGIELKNKYIIEGGYDPFNRNIVAGVKFKIKFRKKK